jgi:hypothetical protein
VGVLLVVWVGFVGVEDGGSITKKGFIVEAAGNTSSHWFVRLKKG